MKLGDLEHAEYRRDDLFKSLRERLLRGFTVDFCMAEVAGRQCLGTPQLSHRFMRLLGFCHQHCALPNAIIDAVEEARASAAARATAEAWTARNEARAAEMAPEPGVYAMYDSKLKRAKIGMTGNKNSRVASVRHSAGGGTELELLAWVPCASRSDAKAIEDILHGKFSDRRIRRTDWFYVDDKVAFTAEIQTEIEASQ